jgi:dipeptidyl aminopeptidase/acylaminoacyl peptidase
MKSTRFSAALFILLASNISAQQPAGDPRRGITAEDYFSFELASDPRISPDGSQVVYVVSRVDRAQNRRVPSIWISRIDGAPRLLIDEAWNASTPRWSADGKTISFISARSPDDTTRRNARAQLWLVSADGSGAPRRVSSVKNGVSNCTLSPKGDRAVCLSRTGLSDSVERKSDVRHYAQSGYKFNDTGWFDDRHSHIWIIDVATGTARQITSGEMWNDTDPQWSPDGTRVAFVSDRSGHEFDDSGRNADVWVIPASGGVLTKISTSTGADNSPRWSPDGKSIAFVSAASEDDPPSIFVAPSTGGAPVDVAPELDLIPTDLQWVGNALYFDTGVKGEYHVFRVDLTLHKVQQVTTGSRAVRSPSFSANGTFAYLVNDFTHLDDVAVATPAGGREHRVSSLNAALYKQVTLVGVERVTFKGADGWDVDGFLVKPLGFDPAKKYPLILSVHGGPAGQYGVDWFHEFQMYAAKGWGVFFTNPRGSTGYGRKFQRGIVNEWGGKDFIDIMNGLDAAIAANPWIDTTRLGVTGGSYGGYMTNWIVGHTNRFKAAVTLRSISNFISDDGTRDGAYGHKDDFGGDIFQRYDLFWDRSPLKYVQNVQTPILILHSDNDYRVPIEQGEQWFRALRHFGKTAEIVFFPRENHNLTRTGEPKHLVESLNWQTWWFEKYLEGKKSPSPD